MGESAIIFAVDVLISTLCIWLATKFSFVKADFKLLGMMVIIVSAVSLAPVVGGFVSLVVFVLLLMKISGCSVVDALWVVLFTKLFSFVAVIGVMEFI